MSACRLLFVLVLLATATLGARVSQRLVGGHAKGDTPANRVKSEEAPEEKKTLSQQVAEGKYGLIQTELFQKPPSRPGVLSYEKNSEVPKDNENSLGGLGPEEIWLAEDHLLVLRGGSFHRTASEMPWPPIDDYRAPNRQVKIPSQPKVPPPFPVQLAEGGPLQFLGFNVTGTAFNGTFEIPDGPEGSPPYLLPPPYQDPTNTSAGRAPFPGAPYPVGTLPENFPRGNGPGPFPFPPFPPSNLNQSQLDEDDPSIYYPPPYSFFYPKDNSSHVPPGPLVPGIVLPPPPDFFGPLEPKTTTTNSTTTTERTIPTRTTTRTTSRTTPRTTPAKPANRYLPYETETPRVIVTTEAIPVTRKPTLLDFHEVPYDENELSHVQLPANAPTISTVPVLRVPYNENIQRLKATYSPPTESPIYQTPYKEQRPRTRLQQATPTTSRNPFYNEQYEKNVQVPPAESPLYRIPYEEQRTRTRLQPTIPTTTPRQPYYQHQNNQKQQLVTEVPVYHNQYDEKRPRTRLQQTVQPTTARAPFYQDQYNQKQTVTESPIYRNKYEEQRPRTRLQQAIQTTREPYYQDEYNQKQIVTETPVYRNQYEEQRPRTRLQQKLQTTTPREQYNHRDRQPYNSAPQPYNPTLSTGLQVPRTYLRPTSGPIVQVSYGGNQHNPRTYLKPTSGPANTVIQIPFEEERPRTYLKPTSGTTPVSVQFVPYKSQDKVPNSNSGFRGYDRAPPRTRVSSTAVPLKNYFSSVDVDTNSVQPQAEYYFYEEDSTPRPAQNLRYMQPNSFEKHVQQLRQQIQSYLKPSAKPVYEYSFQAANYRPTRPPNSEYITPSPQLQYITPVPQYLNQRPNGRYQDTRKQNQDEHYLDDVTKKYFTAFGQKLTTPVAPALSLSGDTDVNYRKPLPINPDAEYVNIRPQVKQRPSGGPGTYISYDLPGDGAHFYFLTPQLVQQQQQQQQQKGYFYQKPDERIPRRNQR